MKMISSNVVAAVKYALPHGLVQTVFRHQAIKRRMLEAKNRKHATALSKTSEYSYKSAIEYHRIRGMTNGHLVAGSIRKPLLTIAVIRLTNSCREIGRFLASISVIF
jgi:hypothetical protein